MVESTTIENQSYACRQSKLKFVMNGLIEYMIYMCMNIQNFFIEQDCQRISLKAFLLQGFLGYCGFDYVVQFLR